MTVTDEQALLRSVLLDPADDTPRLVFADWLDEHAGAVPCGHCGGSGWLYWNVVGVESGRDRCIACDGSGSVPDVRRERAEFIRVQCELAAVERRLTELLNDDTDWDACTGLSARWCPNCGDCRCRNPEESMSDDDCPLHSEASPHLCLAFAQERRDELQRRQEQLFRTDWLPDFGGQLRQWWLGAKPPGGTVDRPFAFVVRRGFAESVEMVTADFLRHAPALFSAQPVTGVRLADRSPVVVESGYARWWLGVDEGGGTRSPERAWAIPEALFDRLPHGPAVTLRQTFVDYRSESDGIAALSAACVAFGRDLAGLPLTVPPAVAPAPAPSPG